ncbi:MAG TPA: T9SS type A sorting domain-containing protein [Puia sp.]
MKRRKSIPLFLLMALMSVSTLTFAGGTYLISSNKNWSAVLPASCSGCTISISSGATLTIDEDATCQNCIFSGGKVVINSHKLNLQYVNNLTTTYFIGTTVQVNGTGQVIANAPLSLTGSTFTFNNTSYLNTSYEVDIISSTINLNDNSTMYSTGSSSTPINLIGSSKIQIGNGSQTSNAALTVSGPALTLFDQSSVNIANQNNIYNNWANFTYHSTAPAIPSKSYSTQNNTISCGSGYTHSCANPFLYGPVALSSAGLVPGNTLPVVLVGFTALLNNDKTITLDWNTQMEVNSSSFEIERSADGENWTAIGSVIAKGNSSVITNYSFTDAQPLAGTNLYRLRMIDLDNSYGYTDVKVIRTSVVNKISFFPNPAREYVNVSLGTGSGKQVVVRLISPAGQLLQEKSVESGAGVIVSFPVGNYAPGLYILSVVGADGTRESRQLLISRS